MPIFMHDRDGRYVVRTLGQVGFSVSSARIESPLASCPLDLLLTFQQLLPMSFGPDSLPPPDELDKARREMGEA
jgi:hypothetical protein